MAKTHELCDREPRKPSKGKGREGNDRTPKVKNIEELRALTCRIIFAFFLFLMVGPVTSWINPLWRVKRPLVLHGLFHVDHCLWFGAVGVAKKF